MVRSRDWFRIRTRGEAPKKQFGIAMNAPHTENAIRVGVQIRVQLELELG